MKAQLDCIECMFRQALNTARVVGGPKGLHLRVLQELARLVAGASLDRTPAALSQPVYEVIARVTGVRDPYRKMKKETNRIALRMLPMLRRTVRDAADPLDAALHVAVAGNIIDLGIGHKFDMKRDVRDLIRRPFAADATEEFRRELRGGRSLLYVGDNAGEIVFDRVLIELLAEQGMDVTFSVKSGPIINDATMSDAVQTGMTRVARVIETGSNDIGINWAGVSAEFRRAFESADVVVGKGHGNFETCEDRPGNIYFLLKAKCGIVAEALGVKLGDIVFKRSVRRHGRRRAKRRAGREGGT